MIFCCDFWWRNQYPKFYTNTVNMMKSMNEHAFLKYDDFDIFISRLKKRIEKDKPKGHTAHVNFVDMRENGKGQVFLVSGKDETDIARLYFHIVGKIKTYGFVNQASFDVFKILERDEL